MINTFYSSGELGTGLALSVSFVIGLLFGAVLERAGFGSSRRLAGVFHLTDMAVLKVMFAAMVTAAVGLAFLTAFGMLGPESVYLMPSVYGTYAVGGILFGAGFVMAGWCPGTAVVGLASGKIDALLFVAGVLGGSMLYNEAYPHIGQLTAWGDAGVQLAYDSLGIQRGTFLLGMTVVAVLAFWVSEFIESRRGRTGQKVGKGFLLVFTLVLLMAGAGAYAINPQLSRVAEPETAPSGQLAAISRAADHIEPEELAERLMAGEPGLHVVDIRPENEFREFHIRGAVNIPLERLAGELAPHKNRGLIVLYSNGMTHPAQAWMALSGSGFNNAYILTDGLKGFMERCLKPASLRPLPLAPEEKARIDAMRAFFLAPGAAAAESAAAVETVEFEGVKLPGQVTCEWLEASLGHPGLRVIDVRSQPEYNGGHIPGSVCLSPESVRGVVNGLSSMLLPADALAGVFSRMGVTPDSMVVIAPGRVRDATLVAMALERLGHARYALLDGGYPQWLAEGRPLDTALPDITGAAYPPLAGTDAFTVDAAAVLKAVQDKSALILDVRPAANYTGEKSDEVRAGHIPGAINRPYKEDLAETGGHAGYKPLAELEKAYAALLPDKNARVIVHCRTGHQASQTWFLLHRLLGYPNVLWYDAGWSEWSSRPELPVETSGGAA